MKTIQRTLSTLMAVCMLLSLVSFPAYATEDDAKRTIKMGFDPIEWVLLAEVPFAGDQYFDGDNIKPEYENTKVALIPVTAAATTGTNFIIRSGAQFVIKFDPSVLRYNDSLDVSSAISTGGRNPTTMPVTASKNIESANEKGAIELVFADTSGATYTVTNDSVLGYVFLFLKDDSKKNSTSDVSFGDDVKIVYRVDENKVSLVHDFDASAVGTVPAYDPDAKTYTVHFDGNGATSGSMTDQDFPDGAAQNLSENQFARTGFDFNGWNDKQDGSGNKYADKAQFTPTKEGVTTLYAQWKEIPKTYTVHFDGNGATSGSMTDQDFPDGAAQNLSENQFARTGFDFDGWSETADGDVKYADKAQFTPTKEGVTTLYAQWKEIDESHTITVTVTPAEGGTVEVDKTTAKEGESVTLTVKPDMNKGYILNKLTVTDSEGEIQAAQTNTITADSSVYTFTMRKSNVTVNAEFIIPTGPYSVTIASDIEGGTVESDKTEAVSGEEVELTVKPDLNNGYVLDKLTVTDSDGEIEYAPRTNTVSAASSVYVFTMRKSNVTVDAVFITPTPVPHSVKTASGVESDKSEAVEGETVTLTVKPDTGYQLKTLTVKDDSGEIATKKIDENTYTFVMGTSDVTVQVEFEPVEPPVKEVTVTYSPGEGTGEAFSESKKQPFTLPGKPDAFTPPSGKSFDGWTLPGSDEVHKAGESLDLNADTTITAHYKQNSSDDKKPGNCYVATAVYGSYDCPEVWTLRRFRDDVLAQTWYGRLFIKCYYAVSPTAVKLFGDTDWFQNFWRGKLDKMVANLQAEGFASTPYQDIDW